MMQDSASTDCYKIFTLAKSQTHVHVLQDSRNHCPKPINVDQNYGIDPNADQFLSMSTNSSQCRSMPDQCSSGIDRH